MIPLIETAQEREEAHQRWVNEHYFEWRRWYTYEIERWAGRGEWPLKWQVRIKQAEAPWMLVCIHSFLTPWGAWLFARGYMKRGKPPQWYIDRYLHPKPRRRDPHMIRWGGRWGSSRAN